MESYDEVRCEISSLILLVKKLNSILGKDCQKSWEILLILVNLVCQQLLKNYLLFAKYEKGKFLQPNSISVS